MERPGNKRNEKDLRELVTFRDSPVIGGDG